jgi:hypothetical protein
MPKDSKVPWYFRADNNRWWGNLENGLDTLLKDGTIRGDTTVQTLLSSVRERCSCCGVPFAFHGDKVCEEPS